MLLCDQRGGVGAFAQRGVGACARSVKGSRVQGAVGGGRSFRGMRHTGAPAWAEGGARAVLAAVGGAWG